MTAVASGAAAAAAAIVTWAIEAMHIETLDDSGETSAENNSSAIMLLRIDGYKLLFTGDAGILALAAAADFAESMNISLTDLRFVQIPYHGSKRNVGPTVLKRIRAGTAYVSAAREGSIKGDVKKQFSPLPDECGACSTSSPFPSR